MEISIPDVSITHSIPRAISIVNALFLKICERFAGDKNDGLMIEMTATNTINTITRLASLELVICLISDLFLFMLPPPYRTAP